MGLNWKEAEREIGRFLWEHDKPDDWQIKPRTGEIHGVGADAESKHFIAEAKFTRNKKGFRITLDIMDKIKERAASKGKLPLVYVRMPYGKFVVLDLETFGILIEAYKEVKNGD